MRMQPIVIAAVAMLTIVGTASARVAPAHARVARQALATCDSAINHMTWGTDRTDWAPGGPNRRVLDLCNRQMVRVLDLHDGAAGIEDAYRALYGYNSALTDASPFFKGDALAAMSKAARELAQAEKTRALALRELR